jgi:kinesin family member 13
LTRLNDQRCRLQAKIDEANGIARQMRAKISYDIHLRLSPSYFKANKRSLDELCQLMIEVRRKDGIVQYWTDDQFAWRFDAIKNAFEQWRTTDLIDCRYDQLFWSNDDNDERFVGVANIYLKALLYQTRLQYAVPIISANGKVSHARSIDPCRHFLHCRSSVRYTPFCNVTNS